MLKDSPRGSWKNRRIYLLIVTAFCMFAIVACMFAPVPLGVATTVVPAAFFLLAAMVGSYVFGAAWDDLNKMRLGSPEPEAAPPVGIPQKEK